MATRVIQLATGVTGRHCLEAVIDRPDLDLAGVLVFDREKDGQDAGSLVGLPDTGVRCTRDFEEILACDADVAIHCLMLDPSPGVLDSGVMRLLESGKNVISTVGYIHPLALGGEYAAQFDAACQKGGATLLGTGINPGFLLERVVPLVSTATLAVDSIVAQEFFNLADCPSEITVKWMLGIGQPPNDLGANDPVAMTFNRLFEPSMRLVERRLGVRFDRIEFDREQVLAEKDEQLAATLIEAGTVGAVRWRWRGYVGGVPFLTFAMWHRGATHLEGEWNFDDHWTVTMHGHPGIHLSYSVITEAGETPLDAAARMTAAVVIRSIPEVISAAPGILQVPVFGT